MLANACESMDSMINFDDNNALERAFFLWVACEISV